MVLVARLANERVVIELDRHDKLLADALKAHGVAEIDRDTTFTVLVQPDETAFEHLIILTVRLPRVLGAPGGCCPRGCRRHHAGADEKPLGG